MYILFQHYVTALKGVNKNKDWHLHGDTTAKINTSY